MTPNTTLRVINGALRRAGRTRLVPPAMVGARVFDVGVHASPQPSMIDLMSSLFLQVNPFFCSCMKPARALHPALVVSVQRSYTIPLRSSRSSLRETPRSHHLLSAGLSPSASSCMRPLGVQSHLDSNKPPLQLSVAFTTRVHYGLVHCQAFSLNAVPPPPSAARAAPLARR